MQEPDKEMLRRISEEFDLTVNNTPEEIADDFRRIFHGPDPVSPIESLFDLSSLSEPGAWSKKADEVMSFYESCGLMLEDEFGLPPDHIAVEFLFISYLLENGMITELESFFRDHIMKWVPAFCVIMEGTAGTEFYKELSRITKEVVLLDYEELMGER